MEGIPPDGFDRLRDRHFRDAGLLKGAVSNVRDGFRELNGRDLAAPCIPGGPALRIIEHGATSRKDQLSILDVPGKVIAARVFRQRLKAFRGHFKVPSVRKPFFLARESDVQDHSIFHIPGDETLRDPRGPREAVPRQDMVRILQIPVPVEGDRSVGCGHNLG